MNEYDANITMASNFCQRSKGTRLGCSGCHPVLRRCLCRPSFFRRSCRRKITGISGTESRFGASTQLAGWFKGFPKTRYSPSVLRCQCRKYGFDGQPLYCCQTPEVGRCLYPGWTGRCTSRYAFDRLYPYPEKTISRYPGDYRRNRSFFTPSQPLRLLEGYLTTLYPDR